MTSTDGQDRLLVLPTLALVHWCGEGLDAEAWALEVRPWERTGVGCVRLKRLECDNLGCTGKKPGPTREVRLAV